MNHRMNQICAKKLRPAQRVWPTSHKNPWFIHPNEWFIRFITWGGDLSPWECPPSYIDLLHVHVALGTWWMVHYAGSVLRHRGSSVRLLAPHPTRPPRNKYSHDDVI